MLHTAGLVRTPHLITVQREDLVATYIGETGKKTLEVVAKASGGTLLVDEVYRLVPADNSRDFGPEALDALMSVMEGESSTSTDRPAIIFAGYAQGMARVTKHNPGMARRITHRFVFPDYTIPEIVQIMIHMAEKDSFVVRANKAELVKMIEEHFSIEDLSLHNAGFGSRLYNEARECADQRVAALIKSLPDDRLDKMGRNIDILSSLMAVDFKAALKKIDLTLD